MRIYSLAMVGIAAAGLLLAVPSVSQAQYCEPGYGSSYGSRSYSRYDDYGGYGGYDRSYSRYGGQSNYHEGYDHGHRDGGYYGRRSVIVHPEVEHWTPNRGWHTHGHIHVPHRGHYHTRPY
jgi:hypothetical protein